MSKIVHTYAPVLTWFFATISQLQKTQKTVTIGLPGGHSLDGFYAELLAQPTLWREVDTSGVRFCLVDERCVPVDSPDRNDVLVWEKLIHPLCEAKILTEKQFICSGDEVDPLEYSLNVGEVDMALFGIGPDGHIASLFPDHPALEAQAEGYIVIHDAPKNPPKRISLTPISVAHIPHTCLFAVGEQKKEAIANFLDEKISWQNCPAKLLVPEIVLDGTTDETNKTN